MSFSRVHFQATGLEGEETEDHAFFGALSELNDAQLEKRSSQAYTLILRSPTLLMLMLIVERWVDLC